MIDILSIIIITKNEEKLLPRLLKSIKEQDFIEPYEIILSDVSTDRTPEIAKSFGCSVVTGGLPSRGRNNGAAAARGDILLFLDADVVLPKGFLSRNLAEFRKRRLCAATPVSVPLTRRYVDRTIYEAYNFLIRITQLFYPNAAGYCIFCTKKTFDNVKGFDEDVVMWEDAEFIKRCGRHGRFRLLKSVPVLCDIRRLDKEGRAKMVLKFSYLALHRILTGEMHKCPVNYDMQGVNMKHIKGKPRIKKEHILKVR